jgi:hypothetical protein
MKQPIVETLRTALGEDKVLTDKQTLTERRHADRDG